MTCQLQYFTHWWRFHL